MWMNEHEVDSAARQFADHPVLGPATATLAALVDWTNRNSDGWPYWRKPSQAAAKLQELVQQGVRHERERYQRPQTPEPTGAELRAALRPVKAFRTKQEKTAGPGLRPIFPVYEPLAEGKSGRTFAAELAMAQAEALHTEASTRERAAHELMKLAIKELTESRQVDTANGVLAQLKARMPQAREHRMLRLATPGTQVWLMPEYIGGIHNGLGHLAESLGMTGPTTDHLVVIKDPEHDKSYNWRRLNPSVVLLPDEAAERWWIVTAVGNLVTGGHVDRERMLTLAEGTAPGCRVVQGAEFVPDQLGKLVPGTECDECQARIPAVEPAKVNRHHSPHCSLHPGLTAPELASGPENYGYVPKAVADAEDR